MKTLIVLNGECKDTTFLKLQSAKFDKIICADGGYTHTVSAGVFPDFVVGDFDSSKIPTDVKCIVFPKEKDLSDAEIAIDYAIDNFGDDVTLTCALGKRLDHQMFNVFLLAEYPKLRIEEKDTVVFLCKDSNDFSEYANKTVSFLPIEKSNITLSNFKYNVSNCDIRLGKTVTLSNIALKNATVDVNYGKVIAIINKTDN